MHDHSNPILDLIFAFWRVETYGRLLELADHGQHMIKETPKVTPYTYWFECFEWAITKWNLNRTCDQYSLKDLSSTLLLHLSHIANLWWSK